MSISGGNGSLDRSRGARDHAEFSNAGGGGVKRSVGGLLRKEPSSASVTGIGLAVLHKPRASILLRLTTLAHPLINSPIAFCVTYLSC